MADQRQVTSRRSRVGGRKDPELLQRPPEPVPPRQPSTASRHRSPLRPLLIGLSAAAGFFAVAPIAQAEGARSGILTSIAPAKISGSVDTSAIWQIDGTKVAAGRWLDSPARQNHLNLQAIYLSLDKPAAQETCSVGYKFVLMAGDDAKPATGDDVGIHNAFFRFHTALGAGTDLLAGVWSSLSGFEYMESHLNPNFSHSFGFSAIEPGRQTGLLTDCALNKSFRILLGVSSAYTSGIGARPYKFEGGVLVHDDAKTYMGAISLTAPEHWSWLKGANLYASLIRGKTAPRVGHTPFAGQTATNFYAGLTLPTPYKELSFVLTYDYVGYARLGSPVARDEIAPSHAAAVALYTIVKPTEKLTIAHRLDFGTSTQGYFGGYTSPLRARHPGNDRLLSNTITVAYPLWANVLSRVEFRWDHDLDTHGGAGAFADGDTNACSLALNLVYTF